MPRSHIFVVLFVFKELSGQGEREMPAMMTPVVGDAWRRSFGVLRDPSCGSRQHPSAAEKADHLARWRGIREEK